MKIILDVHSRAEFSGGNVLGSINIPLDELLGTMNEIGSKNQELICCCASGMRSECAQMILIQNGFQNVRNGGSWMDVNYKLNK